MKVVINTCYGGFGLSTKAYEKLAEYGVPVKRYIQQERGPDGLYHTIPENEGEVIFDRELTPPDEDQLSAFYHQYKDKVSRLNNRYWDTWTRESRTHPLVIRVVEELGAAADGGFANLKIVEIPDHIEWTIEEYDGQEWIAEAHETWS